MFRLTLLLLSVLFGHFIYAANSNEAVGSRASAMGNASLGFRTAFSAFHNQAGLGSLKRFEVAAAYRNNFLLQETGLKSAVVALPFENLGTFAVSVNSFGFSEYGEHKFGFAYARSFGGVFNMGLQFNYHQIQFSEPYQNTSAITAELGLQGQITDQLLLSAHIFNPTRSELSSTFEERLPTVLRGGIQYSFSESLMTSMEYEKDMDKKGNFKAGFEYMPVEVIAIRLGFNTYPVKFSFGAGYQLKNLYLDVASEYHTTLGFVPNFSLRYRFGQQGDEK